MRKVLQDARIAAFDFDNTIFATFERSPGGIGVTEAYDMSLERLFGKPGLLESVGGLKNRAPTELVRDVIAADPGLLARGNRMYEIQRDRLAKLMPRGKGIPLVPLHEADRLALLGEMLVRLKLELLMDEVGPSWPLPFAGALEFLEDLRERDKTLAIISSGHDAFIRRCFGEWGARCPEIVLSDDDLRPLPDPIEKKTKPNGLLIQYVIMMANMRGRKMTARDLVYFGDDIDKDGRLAANALVPFGHFCPGASEPDPRIGPDGFLVTSWDEARRALH